MTEDSAIELLRRMLGPSAEFRDGQWEAVERVANQGQRLLVVQRTGWGKSGIIYCLTIQDTRRVAEWLRRNGIEVRAYHADLDGEPRVEAEQLLLDNQVKALVATVALGMGFDKPDLGFVIHFQRPGSVVAYYQQVRNLLGAFVVEGPVPPGPVLLVDDVVDSGWTLTLLAVMLRQHGSGPVYPFALAKASPRGG